ncbi:MAG: 50S ribosomal protein L22 [Rhodospirillales bacterium]|nr:50S ribosomal protein L22 [Alphaproteobacteria bacterium]USO04305.1 MAG: 50S ribosomal protein L22 [Rhodospirillales bacterium]
MGQTENKKRAADNEARAMAKHLRTSPQKLNLVAQMIRGKSAGKALTDLEFSPRRIAKAVHEVLKSAVSNAENNHGLDVDRLYVAEAYVGKDIMMKRWRARARGRSAKIMKPFSRLTVVVREREDEMVKAPAKKAAPKKTESKKTPEKKEEAKKETAPKKAAPKKTAEKKDTEKKATAKKPAAKKAPAKSTKAETKKDKE